AHREQHRDPGEPDGRKLEREAAAGRIAGGLWRFEDVAHTVVPDQVEGMPRSPPGDCADRYQRGDHERRLQCKPGDDNRAAESRWEAQARAQRGRLGCREAVALRLQVRVRPAHRRFVASREMLVTPYFAVAL